ncbi:unnamed protein product [Rhizoctonia solani]|uniref:Rhodanese domain-containing protein n=1 Tax=Rhizoctonia solani TaxID=456999 RepID=A0A8H3AL24_9AGAM|nr:unnamed protein product [Rhizoctonia solani]
MAQLNELESLRARVKLLEDQIRSLGHEPIEAPMDTISKPGLGEGGLGLDEYIRYGRQMILPGFGLRCRITIVDHDCVEVSNLHRQVLHGVDGVGKSKVESAKQALFRLNPSIDIVTHCISLTLATLPVVFAPNVRFHAVLDCTDTPSTRYLLSDVTARLGIPLISGAAQRTDGQLVVYNLPPPAPLESTNSNESRDPAINTADPANPVGPCMRCIFPSVSRTGAGAERCSDVGVLGPVVGVIGVLMALETIKILTGFGVEGLFTIVYRIVWVVYLFLECQLHKPSMLLFTGLSPRPFRNIKLRPRQSECPGCSTLLQGLLVSELMADVAPLEDSYNQYCNIGDSRIPDDPISAGARDGEPGTRVKASVLKEALISATANPTISLTIIDTRPPTEFGICSISGSVNVPLSLLLKAPESYISISTRTFVVCRLGNDSQVAARALRSALRAKEDDTQEKLDNVPGRVPSASSHRIVDVIGGLRAWAQEVDQSFPIY